MSDKDILQAAYDLLTKRGNELARRTADGRWDGHIDSAQHYLGLLLLRLNNGQSLDGRPPLEPANE